MKKLPNLKKYVRGAANLFWGMCLLLFLLPRGLFADSKPNPCDDPTHLCNPIRFPNFIDFLFAIVDVAIQYGAVLIVVFIVFSGFKFVTAQGNSEKVSEARKMLTWVVIGAFVLLGVYVIKAAICGTIEQLGITATCAKTTPTVR